MSATTQPSRRSLPGRSRPSDDTRTPRFDTSTNETRRSRTTEAAVIAWMRHQTTAYDNLSIPRIAGARREVRRELAQISRTVLGEHRRDAPHAQRACPLCTALAAPPTADAVLDDILL